MDFRCPLNPFICIWHVCEPGTLDFSSGKGFGLQWILRKVEIHCTEINSSNHKINLLTSLLIFWWLLISSRVILASCVSASHLWNWGQDLRHAKDSVYPTQEVGQAPLCLSHQPGVREAHCWTFTWFSTLHNGETSHWEARTLRHGGPHFSLSKAQNSPPHVTWGSYARAVWASDSSLPVQTR